MSMDHRVIELAEKIYVSELSKRMCIKDGLADITEDSMWAAQVFYDVHKKEMMRVDK